MTKLKVLELFGGIGACSKALERLGIDYEIADYVEIDKYAVKSFNAIHGTDFEPQDITEWDKGYQCPNCGHCFDTGKFHEDDDEAYEDVCPYCGCYPTEPTKGNIDLIMHGSPCQDFSVAGRGAGGDKDSGTRSSLMYETLRIVAKLKPKYVIWENVKNVLSKKHRHNFDAYLDQMESLGYKNYFQVLNAKDYGIPQNRERVFTISILAEHNFDFKFPEKIPLEVRLKDILEPKVDEKFYLSDAQVDKIKLSTFNQARTRIQEGDVSQTLCARDWKDPKCVKIIDPQGRLGKVNTPKDYAPTLRAQDHGNPPMAIINEAQPVKRRRSEYWKQVRKDYEAHKLEHDEAMREEYLASDGITPTLTTSRREQRIAEPVIKQVAQIYGTKTEPNPQAGRIYDSDGISPTVDSCSGGNRMPKIIDPELKYIGGIGDVDRVGDGKGLSRNFPQGNRVYSSEGIAVSQTANGGGLGGKTGLYQVEDEPHIVASRGRGEKGNTSQHLEPRHDGVTNTITTVQKDNYVEKGYRIRKLTPKECWRLMGFDDSDFEKAQQVNSNTQLYKQAGNSIVVNVLEGILGNLL